MSINTRAWLSLAVLTPSIVITFFLMRHNPALLERRMRGGPAAEKRPAQRLIMLGTSLGFIGLLLWRLLDEERFLAKSLPEYYQQRVRYRLVPFVW